MRLAAIALVMMGWAASAHAQDGSDLASPRRGGPAPARTAAPEVQDLRAVSAADASSAAPRVYGDGEGEALGWEDPERDLSPMGFVHFVLQAHAAFLAGDGAFGEAVHFGLAPAIDICLMPTLSLHLRIGARVGAHVQLAPGRALSVGYVRGFMLLGIHAARLVSVRLGAELGPELVVADGRSSGDIAAGGAVVAQLGLRLADGHVELAAELAVDIRPGAEGPAASAERYVHVAPRIGGLFGVTF